MSEFNNGKQQIYGYSPVGTDPNLETSTQDFHFKYVRPEVLKRAIQRIREDEQFKNVDSIKPSTIKKFHRDDCHSRSSTTSTTTNAIEPSRGTLNNNKKNVTPCAQSCGDTPSVRDLSKHEIETLIKKVKNITSPRNGKSPPQCHSHREIPRQVKPLPLNVANLRNFNTNNGTRVLMQPREYVECVGERLLMSSSRSMYSCSQGDCQSSRSISPVKLCSGRETGRETGRDTSKETNKETLANRESNIESNKESKGDTNKETNNKESNCDKNRESYRETNKESKGDANRETNRETHRESTVQQLRQKFLRSNSDGKKPIKLIYSHASYHPRDRENVVSQATSPLTTPRSAVNSPRTPALNSNPHSNASSPRGSNKSRSFVSTATSPIVSPRPGILRKLSAHDFQDNSDKFNKGYLFLKAHSKPDLTVDQTYSVEEYAEPKAEVAKIVENVVMEEYQKPQPKWVEVIEANKEDRIETKAPVADIVYYRAEPAFRFDRSPSPHRYSVTSPLPDKSSQSFEETKSFRSYAISSPPREKSLRSYDISSPRQEYSSRSYDISPCRGASCNYVTSPRREREREHSSTSYVVSALRERDSSADRYEMYPKNVHVQNLDEPIGMQNFLPTLLMTEVIKDNVRLAGGNVNVSPDANGGDNIQMVETVCLEDSETEFDASDRPHFTQYLKSRSRKKDVRKIVSATDDHCDNRISEYIEIEKGYSEVDLSYMRDTSPLSYTDMADTGREHGNRREYYIQECGKYQRSSNPSDNNDERLSYRSSEISPNRRTSSRDSRRRGKSLKEQHLQRTFERLARSGRKRDCPPAPSNSRVEYTKQQHQSARSCRITSSASLAIREKVGSHTERCVRDISINKETVAAAAVAAAGAARQRKSSRRVVPLRISKSIEDQKSEKTLIFQKMTDIQVKIIEVLDKLRISLLELKEPKNIFEKTKRQKNALEFAVRFSRNFLYPLKGLLEELKHTPPEQFNSLHSNDACNRVCYIYNLQLQSLTTYQKQLRYFHLDHVPQKLPTLIDIIYSTTVMCLEKKIFSRQDERITFLQQGCKRFLDFLKQLQDGNLNTERENYRKLTLEKASPKYELKMVMNPLNMYEAKLVPKLGNNAVGKPKQKPKRPITAVPIEETKDEIKEKPRDDQIPTHVQSYPVEAKSSNELQIDTQTLTDLGSGDAAIPGLDKSVLEAMRHMTQEQVRQILEPIMQSLSSALGQQNNPEMFEAIFNAFNNQVFSPTVDGKQLSEDNKCFSEQQLTTTTTTTTMQQMVLSPKKRAFAVVDESTTCNPLKVANRTKTQSQQNSRPTLAATTKIKYYSSNSAITTTPTTTTTTTAAMGNNFAAVDASAAAAADTATAAFVVSDDDSPAAVHRYNISNKNVSSNGSKSNRNSNSNNNNNNNTKPKQNNNNNNSRQNSSRVVPEWRRASEGDPEQTQKTQPNGAELTVIYSSQEKRLNKALKLMNEVVNGMPQHAAAANADNDKSPHRQQQEEELEKNSPTNKSPKLRQLKRTPKHERDRDRERRERQKQHRSISKFPCASSSSFSTSESEGYLDSSRILNPLKYNKKKELELQQQRQQQQQQQQQQKQQQPQKEQPQQQQQQPQQNRQRQQLSVTPISIGNNNKICSNILSEETCSTMPTVLQYKNAIEQNAVEHQPLQHHPTNNPYNQSDKPIGTLSRPPSPSVSESFSGRILYTEESDESPDRCLLLGTTHDLLKIPIPIPLTSGSSALMTERGEMIKTDDEDDDDISTSVSKTVYGEVSQKILTLYTCNSPYEDLGDHATAENSSSPHAADAAAVHSDAESPAEAEMNSPPPLSQPKSKPKIPETFSKENQNPINDDYSTPRANLNVAQVMKEREGFLKLCERNRFYKNPTFDEPWKIFPVISERLLNVIMDAVEIDFNDGVSKFVEDFLELEIKSQP